MKKTIAIAVLLFYSHCLAGDIEIVAMNNFSHECIECSVYYAIAAEAARRSKRFELEAIILHWQEYMLEAGIMTGKINRTEEMAEKVFLSRLEMSKQSAMEKIGSNIENISVLMIEYSDRCKQIAENPESIMKKYVEKARLKFGK